jgi:hypothetical protein
VAGWSRGDGVQSSVLLASLGVIVTVTAHLIVALTAAWRWPVRALSGLLWIGCMAWVVASHAAYILASQQARGEQRATAVTAPEPVVNRALSTVLMERSKTESQLASVTAVQCGTDCSAVLRKAHAFRGRIAALNQEVAEIRQSTEAEQRFRREQDRRRADPAMLAVALWLDLRVEFVHLVSGLLAGTLLDCIGCVCWALTASARRGSSELPANESGVTVKAIEPTDGHSVTPGGVAADVTVLTSMQVAAAELPVVGANCPDVLEQAAAAVRSGELRITVRSIRAHLKCSQRAALEISRALRAMDMSRGQSGAGTH